MKPAPVDVGTGAKPVEAAKVVETLVETPKAQPPKAETASKSAQKAVAIESALLGVPKADYGDDYSKHIMEQYKVFVDSADRISARRTTANSFFLTLNSALVGLLALNLPGFTQRPPEVMVAVAIAGAVNCWYWRRLLRSYSDLNGIKFRVIHHIEQRLPLKPYDAEWKAAGEGLDHDKYLPVTNVERAVPWVFLALHAGVGLLGALTWLK